MRLMALAVASIGSAVWSSPLTVASDVIAAGNVTLTASDTAATGDDLTINAGVTVSSSAALTMRAGDDFFLFGTAAAVGSPISIWIDFGDLDPGVGATASLLGDLSGVPGATVTGGADADLFIIMPDDTTPISVVGAAGSNILDYRGTGGVVTFFTATSGVISASGVADVSFSGITGIRGATGAPPVPEPGTYAMFGLALAGYAIYRRRRAA